MQYQVDPESECEFASWKRINLLTKGKSYVEEYIRCDNSVSHFVLTIKGKEIRQAWFQLNAMLAEKQLIHCNRRR